jgi:phosphoribosyl-ATP pyrophosphohydrolase
MTPVRGTRTPDGAGVPTLFPDAAQSSVAERRFARFRHSTALPSSSELDRLYRSLADVTAENHPRTAKLLDSSTRKVAQKVFEEAGEVALEAVRHKSDGIVRESADLLYHLAVLWHRAGIDPTQVWSEMRARADELGIAEKLPKDRHRDPRACAGPSNDSEA